MKPICSVFCGVAAAPVFRLLYIPRTVKCLCGGDTLKFAPRVWQQQQQQAHKAYIITTVPSGHFVLVFFNQILIPSQFQLKMPMQRDKHASATNDGSLIQLTSHCSLYRCSNYMVDSRDFLSLVTVESSSRDAARNPGSTAVASSPPPRTRFDSTASMVTVVFR